MKIGKEMQLDSTETISPTQSLLDFDPTQNMRIPRRKREYWIARGKKNVEDPSYDYQTVTNYYDGNPMPSNRIEKKEFWMARGKKGLPIPPPEYDDFQMSNGNPFASTGLSNPIDSKRQYWIARGKKQSDLPSMDGPDRNTMSQFQIPNDANDKDQYLKYSDNGNAFDNQLGAPKLFNRIQNKHNEPDSSDYDMPYDKLSEFWSSRENLLTNEDKPDEKVPNEVYSKPQLNSNYDRNIRFWVARGKREDAFQRLSRMMQTDFQRQRKLHEFYKADEKEPNFWISRGKKMDATMYDDMTEEKTKKRHPLFAKLRGRRPLRAPSYWTNRGRKNFWAARGK